MPFRFRDFKVYKDAIEAYKFIVQITKDFPREYYHLMEQLRRAALSVVLNIAEGSAKNSDKDFNRYIGNSLGSVDEAIACSEVALMEHLISELQFNDFGKLGLEISNQLGGLSKKLKS